MHSRVLVTYHTVEGQSANWDAVDAFAEDVGALVEARTNA